MKISRNRFLPRLRSLSTLVFVSLTRTTIINMLLDGADYMCDFVSWDEHDDIIMKERGLLSWKMREQSSALQ